MGPYLEPLQDSDNLLCIGSAWLLLQEDIRKSSQTKGFATIGSNITEPNEGGGFKH